MARRHTCRPRRIAYPRWSRAGVQYDKVVGAVCDSNCGRVFTANGNDASPFTRNFDRTVRAARLMRKLDKAKASR